VAYFVNADADRPGEFLVSERGRVRVALDGGLVDDTALRRDEEGGGSNVPINLGRSHARLDHLASNGENLSAQLG